MRNRLRLKEHSLSGSKINIFILFFVFDFVKVTLLTGTWSAFCSACGQLGACCLLPSFRLYSKFTSIPSLCLPWGSYWIIWKLQNFWAPELHGMSGLYFPALPVLILDLCSGMYKGSWLVSTLNLHILS